MKKFLIKICLFGGVTLVVGNLISLALNRVLASSFFYKPAYLVNAFPERTEFEYILLGSSRGLTGIDTKRMDEILGVRGVNLSMDDTGLKSHLLMLKHFFRSGYRMKQCVLVLDSGSFEQTSNEMSSNDYRFAPFIDRGYVMDYYLEHEGVTPFNLAITKYFPLFTFSFYNMELAHPGVLTLLKRKKRHRFDERGNYAYPKVAVLGGLQERKEIRAALVNPVLGEFLELTSRNDACLVIYIAPYLSKTIKIDKNPKGIEVINHSSLLQNSNMFYDEIHVNSEGRSIATEALAEAFELRQSNTPQSGG